MASNNYGSIRSRTGPPEGDGAINDELDETSRISSKKRSCFGVVLVISGACIFLLLLQIALNTVRQPRSSISSTNENVLVRNRMGSTRSIPLEGQSRTTSTSTSSTQHSRSSLRSSLNALNIDWEAPKAVERCEYIVDALTSKNENLSRDVLIDTYAKQVVDANVFYRATASIFWQDFVRYAWDDQIYSMLESNPEEDKTTWTWVTGDQHLSNFGAWQNRNNKVVFSVNDFDEAAIYDFHVDILRLSVSIYNHAMVNGLSPNQIQSTIQAFTDTYIETVMSYLGNEDASTFELTQDTAQGLLRKFLQHVAKSNTHHAQLEKYTDRNGRFRLDNTTHLVALQRNNHNSSNNNTDPDDMEHAIRRAFTSQQYGATMMKTGWHVPVWDDHYFAVLDVARRIGSGVGSFGVDRFYVLLNGTGAHDQHIVLDVKYEPSGGVANVLSDDDRAWYGVLFSNEAARAVQAQRHLTSYVDPFTGWVLIHGKHFVVRERSPWKDSPDLDAITDYHDFKTFAKQVAVVTATAHTRGTPAKAPGEFKQVIAKLLGNSHRDKEMWGWAVRQITMAYSEQVKMDYQCFRSFVETNYPEAIALQNIHTV